MQTICWVHGEYELLYVVVAWLPHGQCIDVTAVRAQAVLPNAVWMHCVATVTARSCMSLPCLQTRQITPAETPEQMLIPATRQTATRKSYSCKIYMQPHSLPIAHTRHHTRSSHAQLHSMIPCLPSEWHEAHLNLVESCLRLFAPIKTAFLHRVTHPVLCCC